MSRPRSWFRDLPLFSKFLLPFMALVVSLGILGGFLIVRDLSSRAQNRIDQSLADYALEVRSRLRDRELYLVESVNFGSNLVGVAEGVAAGRRAAVARLLQSVLALKTDLGMVAVTDLHGREMVAFVRSRPGQEPRLEAGAAIPARALVKRVIDDPDAHKTVDFVGASNSRLLAVAAPICRSATKCVKVGVAVVGIDLKRIVEEARRANSMPSSIALYDRQGLLATSGAFAPEEQAPILRPEGPLRRTRKDEGVEIATLYSALSLQGRSAGAVAVSLPTAPALAAVRGAGWTLVLVVVLAMIGVIAVGAALSRFVLARIRQVIATSKALGRGELAARAPVGGTDELGDLARGVNQMAEQLQASHETLELRVEERTEEVRRLLKERTEFFASLSHEFRTPLSIILRQAELMLDESYPKTRKNMSVMGRTVHHSAAAVLGLVNDIIDLVRADAGRIELKFGRVGIRDALEEVRPTAEGLAAAAGLTIEFEDSGTVDLWADSARLRSILLNLIDNAVKYTPQGGRIRIGTRNCGSMLEVSVTDTGVGIPQDALDLVFEPFFTVSGTNTQRGQLSSGLGLALSRRLIEAQGGTIHVSSKPGSGSTFTFALPVAGIAGPSDVRGAKGGYLFARS